MRTFAEESADVQGLIVSGFSHLVHTEYLFIEFAEPRAGRAWLAAIVDQVRTAKYPPEGSASSKKPENAFNIAFNAAGLSALGLTESALGGFPQEFREGMAEPSRVRRLQDPSPADWDFGGTDLEGKPKEPIHALLIFQAETREKLGTFVGSFYDLMESNSIRVVHREAGYREKTQHEHFGFRDGISEPEILDSPKRPTGTQGAPCPTGEFVLGYSNSYHLLPPTPVVGATEDPSGTLPVASFSPDQRDLGRNGTYLVFRKLAQDVSKFRNYFGKRFPDPTERTRVTAKIVGRWPSGAPLALTPNQDDPAFARLEVANNFGYAADDPKGFRCPIGSHVRRTNPRDAFADTAEDSLLQVGRHRIIRRGNSYGPELAEGAESDDTERGLLFVCLNADLARQFEFIQQSWVNNPKFNGLYDDRDPLIGSGEGPATVTIQQQPVRLRLTDIPSFVTMRGGGYFFVPSISAIRFLANMAG